MEIVLLRHGEPKTELIGSLNANEFKDLVKQYEQSDIKDHPPEELLNQFNSYYIVCSELERSIQSAKKLGLKQIHLTHPLFKEIDIPHFDQGVMTLPVMGWLIMLRVMWLFGFEKNGESFVDAKIRAKQAAVKLIELAQENEKIILVGHGLMNRLIAKQLRINNWQGPVSPGKNFWEYGVYSVL